MTIDRIDKHPRPMPEAPDVSRPRLGPGAPPLPPAKGRDETWAAFGLRLMAYRTEVKHWPLTRGWSEHDRASFIAQATDAIAWAAKQVRT